MLKSEIHSPGNFFMVELEDSVGVLRSKDESHQVERIHYLFISLSPVNQKVKAMVKLFRF